MTTEHGLQINGFWIYLVFAVLLLLPLIIEMCAAAVARGLIKGSEQQLQKRYKELARHANKATKRKEQGTDVGSGVCEEGEGVA